MLRVGGRAWPRLGGGRGGLDGGWLLGRGAARPARGGWRGFFGVWQPHGPRHTFPRRGGLGSWQRRWHGRFALGKEGLAWRESLWVGHDQRDARAGREEPGRGRGRERRVPRGPHRGDPAARRARRRGDL